MLLENFFCFLTCSSFPGNDAEIILGFVSAPLLLTNTLGLGRSCGPAASHIQKAIIYIGSLLRPQFVLDSISLQSHHKKSISSSVLLPKLFNVFSSIPWFYELYPVKPAIIYNQGSALKPALASQCVLSASYFFARSIPGVGVRLARWAAATSD